MSSATKYEPYAGKQVAGAMSERVIVMDGTLPVLPLFCPRCGDCGLVKEIHGRWSCWRCCAQPEFESLDDWNAWVRTRVVKS